MAFNNASMGNIKLVITGLRCLSPSASPKLRPIFQFHLWVVKQQFDLTGNQLDWVAWALWLRQWQGCLREGSVIRGKQGGRGAWCAQRDTDRGRVAVGLSRDTNGRVLGAGLTLTLKPGKTDQAGEK